MSEFTSVSINSLPDASKYTHFEYSDLVKHVESGKPLPDHVSVSLFWERNTFFTDALNILSEHDNIRAIHIRFASGVVAVSYPVKFPKNLEYLEIHGMKCAIDSHPIFEQLKGLRIVTKHINRIPALQCPFIVNCIFPEDENIKSDLLRMEGCKVYKNGFKNGRSKIDGFLASYKIDVSNDPELELIN